MKRAIVIILTLLTVCLPLSAYFTIPSNAAAETTVDGSLPVIYINTDSGKNPGRNDNSEYLDGSMRISLNDYYSDCTNDLTGSEMKDIGIRTRGNSTRTFAGVTQTGKYSYKLKLDKKADLFGMGKSKHWILLANVYDITSMRNKTAYELARALGLTYCDSTWVVLYLNGEYRGLYQFCESIRVAKTRVDITDWGDIIENVAKAIAKKEGLDSTARDALEDGLEKDMSWVTSGTYKGYKISDYYTQPLDITSGYIIEYDSFDNSADTRPFLFNGGTTPRGVMLKVDTPEYSYTNTAMTEYVRQLILDFEEAVYSPTFYNSKGKHYSEYCDMDDLVNFWLLQTLVKNGEFGIRSMFFYIEKGKIHWGPVWDFDCGAGNHLTVDTGADGWNGGGNRNQWYHELYGDPYFVTLVQQRYVSVRNTVSAAVNAIEIYHDYIVKEAERDYSKYGSRSFNGGTRSDNFASEYNFYLQWQKNRIVWLDQNLLVKYPNIGGQGPYNSSKLQFALFYGSSTKTLTSDKLTLDGVASDYLYTLSEDGNDPYIRFKLSTTHSDMAQLGIYVNGIFYKNFTVTNSSSASGSIDIEAFCLEPGAVNTVYAVVINPRGSIYNGMGFTVKISEYSNPGSDERVIEVKGYDTVVTKDAEFTLPALKNVDGMTFSGWYCSGKIYKAGSTVTASNNMAFYDVWTHTDGLAVLYSDSALLPFGSGVLASSAYVVRYSPALKEEPPVTTEKTTTDKPVTEPPSTTPETTQQVTPSTAIDGTAAVPATELPVTDTEPIAPTTQESSTPVVETDKETPSESVKPQTDKPVTGTKTEPVTSIPDTEAPTTVSTDSETGSSQTLTPNGNTDKQQESEKKDMGTTFYIVSAVCLVIVAAAAAAIIIIKSKNKK